MLTPLYLNICNLPDNVLQSIKLELTKRINEHPGFLLENSYRNMLKYLDTPFEKNLSRSFKELQIMDKRRNLDSSKIFLDLYKIGNNNG